MTYARTLVSRWTRRDWLAIAVIALTMTFVFGTSITVLASSAAIQGEVERLDGLETAVFTEDTARPGSGVVLPVAAVTDEDGRAAVLVGVPDEAVALTSTFDEATLEPPPSGTAIGDRQAAGSKQFTGPSGSVTVDVEPAPARSVLPARWYVVQAAAVHQVGQTGAFVLHDGEMGAAASEIPREGTLLLGAPAFLVGGALGLVDLLALVTLGSAVLVAVTVYSVTRMTVRDRRRALFVVRATGGSRRRLVGLFALRAGLLTAVGTFFGYAVGVIVVHAALNVATYVGQLTTIDVGGTPLDRLVLWSVGVVVVLVGAGAGALSAGLTAVRPPGALMGAAGEAAWSGDERPSDRAQSWLGLELLGGRSIVPVTATLTVFVIVAVVTASVGATLAPLAGPTSGVVMAPEASFPLESEVDAGLVAGLRAAGITASPEVLVPQVRDGQPYLARGVEYGAFANVSGAELTAGRPPRAPDEAVIGADLALTLGVTVGDTVTVGGGTAYALDRVHIVGRFSGSGYTDDQLLVPLGTAQELANLDSGTVQIIRTSGAEIPPAPKATPTPTAVPTPTATFDLPPTPAATPTAVPTPPPTTSTGTPSPGPTETRTTRPGTPTDRTPTRSPSPTPTPSGPADIVVTGLSVPAEAVVGAPVPVDVTVENRGNRTGTRDLSLRYGSVVTNRTVSVAGGQQRSVTFTARFGVPGRYAVAVDGYRETVTVREPVGVTVSPIPDEAPPGATILVSVRNQSGGAVSGAQVAVDGTAARTNGSGIARLVLPSTPGTYGYQVRVGRQVVRNGSLTVGPGANRTLLADLAVEPSTVELPGEVRVTATVYNPWTATLTQEFTLSRAGATVVRRPVRLAPAESGTVRGSVHPVASAGEQTVAARFDGRTVATATYTVEASDRLLAVLAREGVYVEGSGLVRSLEALVGNLRFLQGTVFALAFLMGIGSTAAAIVQAAHARRRSIGIRRVTGAAPRQVVRTLLADGVRIGGLGSFVGLATAYAVLRVLSADGMMTVYGVRLQPAISPWLAVGILLGALAVVVISSLVAAAWVLRVQPGDLLTESTRRAPKAGAEASSPEHGGR